MKNRQSRNTHKTCYAKYVLFQSYSNQLGIGLSVILLHFKFHGVNTVVSNHINSDHVPTFSCLDVWTNRQATSGVYGMYEQSEDTKQEIRNSKSNKTTIGVYFPWFVISVSSSQSILSSKNSWSKIYYYINPEFSPRFLCRLTALIILL